MDKTLQNLSACRKELDSRSVSSVDLARRSLERSRDSQSKYNPYMAILDRRALESAAKADARLAAGEKLPLLGVPVSVKDLILVEGEKCTASSKILEDFVAPYSATAVKKLEQQGAVIVSKTGLDEFGMGSSNENSAFGPVKNPLDPSRAPGGSSGGSAAALAAGDVPLALGTDTGGSVRQPAAFCGVTGLKPTYGRVSRYGLMAFASSLDQIGPMARDAEGCAALLEAMAGFDPHDGTSSRAQRPAYWAELVASRASGSLNGLRVGIPKELDGVSLEGEVSEELAALVRHLESRGARVSTVSLPHFSLALPTYYVICTSEASSNLSRYNGIHQGRGASDSEELGVEGLYSRARSEGFGPEVRLRVLLGTYALSAGYYDAYYKRAAQVRRLIHKDFSQAYKGVDLLLTPTAPESAFALGSRADDPLKMYASDLCTLPASLAGVPAISFPTNFRSPKLPVGMQFMAPWFEESRLLKIVDALQHEGVGGVV
jgi:aspartyl-tRNA(Asn)/glutamyl-tRNA(Gln) amidotransferase subunit A